MDRFVIWICISGCFSRQLECRNWVEAIFTRICIGVKQHPHQAISSPLNFSCRLPKIHASFAVLQKFPNFLWYTVCLKSYYFTMFSVSTVRIYKLLTFLPLYMSVTFSLQSTVLWRFNVGISQRITFGLTLRVCDCHIYKNPWEGTLKSVQCLSVQEQRNV